MLKSKSTLIGQYQPFIEGKSRNQAVWVCSPNHWEVFVILEKDESEVFGFFQFMNGKKWFFKQSTFEKEHALYFYCSKTLLRLDDFEKVPFQSLAPYVVTMDEVEATIEASSGR